jgi:hypothetical protein
MTVMKLTSSVYGTHILYLQGIAQLGLPTKTSLVVFQVASDRTYKRDEISVFHSLQYAESLSLWLFISLVMLLPATIFSEYSLNLPRPAVWSSRVNS